MDNTSTHAFKKKVEVVQHLSTIPKLSMCLAVKIPLKDSTITTMIIMKNMDVKSNKWLSQRPIPLSPFILSALSVNSNIYIIGGGPLAGLTVTNVSKIFNIKY